MADDEKKKLEEEKKRKQAEIERKRAEVRARMEEASKAKKAKKGFMTPERKKKLRLLLRKKAAEELKKEQERKAAERRRIIEERCGKPKLIDDANEESLKSTLRNYFDRISKLEDAKYDLEYLVRKKDYEIADLNSQVNDLRGKFVKPTLKKVSKYENKFAKLQKKAAEFNFRNQLKVVKKKEFTLEEEDKEKKPDWSKKGEKEEEAGQPPAEAEKPPTEEAAAVPAEESSPATATPSEGETAPSADAVAAPAAAEPAEGAEAAIPAAEGSAPPTEGGETAVAATPTEGETKPEAPSGPFETFKQLVLNENYDIVALPETVLAPTGDKEAVSIPHYSLVENRKNSGDGVVIYIKDTLKYKVVDLTSSENPDARVSFEDLLEKLKSEPAESAAAAPPTEGTPAEGGETPSAAATTEGQPDAAAAAVEGGAAAPSVEAPSSVECATSTETAAPATEAAAETATPTETPAAAPAETAPVQEPSASETPTENSSLPPPPVAETVEIPESPADAAPPIIQATA